MAACTRRPEVAACTPRQEAEGAERIHHHPAVVAAAEACSRRLVGEAEVAEAAHSHRLAAEAAEAEVSSLLTGAEVEVAEVSSPLRVGAAAVVADPTFPSSFRLPTQSSGRPTPASPARRPS